MANSPSDGVYIRLSIHPDQPASDKGIDHQLYPEKSETCNYLRNRFISRIYRLSKRCSRARRPINPGWHSRFSHAAPLLALLGLFLIVALDSRKIPGAIVIGLLTVSLLGWISGLTPLRCDGQSSFNYPSLSAVGLGNRPGPIYGQHHILITAR